MRRKTTVLEIAKIIAKFLRTPILKNIHTFFYKQHFYKQRQAEIGKKSSKC